MRKIEDLHPDLQEKVKLLQAECKKQGLKIGIGECLRTASEQDKLYAKGRTASGDIVTNAKGSTFSSMHQWGVAFDFFRNDGKDAYDDSDGFFGKVGQIGKKTGLVWGGNWKSITDKPHFELPGYTISKLKSQYKKPENFIKSWGDDSMTDAERKEFEELKTAVNVFKEMLEPYHYMTELPEYPDGTGRATIQKLKDRGIYNGLSESDLNLSKDLFKCFVINDRAGLYGGK